MSPCLATSIESRCRWLVALAGVIAFATLAGCNGQPPTGTETGIPSLGSSDGQSNEDEAAASAAPSAEPTSAAESAPGSLVLSLKAPASVARDELGAAQYAVEIRNSGTAGSDVVAVLLQLPDFNVLIKDSAGRQLCDLKFPESVKLATPSLHNVFVIRPRTGVTFYEQAPWPLVSDPPAVGETVYVYAQLKPASPDTWRYVPTELLQVLDRNLVEHWQGPTLVSNTCPIRLTE